MNQKSCLAMLTIGHILCGLVTGYVAEDGPPEMLLAIYVGLFFSQTSLLGVWGGMANSRWFVRLVGTAFGMAYLSLQFCYSLDEWDFEIPLIVFLSTGAVAGAMLVVRRFKARLGRETKDPISPEPEGLQFSIRHLMLLTFVVGCTLGIGKWLQPYFKSAHQMSFLVSLSLCFVSVGVTSVWATLGRARFIFRGCVVVCLALLTASVPAFAFGRGDTWFWILLMLVEAAVLLASLLVVRQCGIRLVRVSRGNP